MYTYTYTDEPECGNCNGTGIVMYWKEGREYGKHCPDCSGGIRREKLLEQTGQNRMITWRNIIPTNGSGAVVRKLKSFPGDPGLLKIFITGTEGTGKTMHASILFYELGMAGRECFFTSTRDVKQCNGKLYGSGVEPAERNRWDQYHRRIVGADFTFIDDFNGGFSESVDQYLQAIVDDRDGHELKTVFISRFGLFPEIDSCPAISCTDRLLSRLRYRADCAYLCCEDMRNRKLKK